MAARNAVDRWPASAGRIRQLLMEMLRKSEGFHEPIAEIVELLDEMDAEVRVAGVPSFRPGPGTIPSIGRKQPKRYTVEKRRRGLHLCEYRIAGRRQPFCCPKDVYELIAAALEKLDRYVQFEELRTVVGKQMQGLPPEYLIRICLRFWHSVDPPIVEKDHTHYRPSARGRFTNAAKRAWRELEKQGSE